MTRLINALRFSATLALAGCSASACEPPLGDPPGEPAATAAPTPSAEPPGAQSAGTDILQLALTIHVEGYNDEARDQSEFDAHLAVLERLSDLAVAYDVILNFELSTTFVQAVGRWGSKFIEEMTAIGHNISQHSGDQSTAVSYTHLRAHETVLDHVCRLLLEKKKVTVKCVDSRMNISGERVLLDPY